MDNSFGIRLKALRTEKGYTQKALAEKLGISPSAVGMYEQGRREPDNAILSQLCYILDTTTDNLLGITQTKNEEVGQVINDFTKVLMNQQGLMFNGQPISESDREKIVIAIRSAAAIVLPDKRNMQGDK
ncbi:MAG: helix-turn-helix transcriptional regulator [Acutalibacteraceae bacterium]|nr:helix-turn-helix transcriptional regulator [Clostridia bacterium]MEE3449120.1 helix-turn-helix transcriptional regulator [Acutalibacteraceae bacterium]